MLLSIPEREFFQLLESRPEMIRHMLGGLTLRLMMVNKRLADMTGSVELRTTRLFLTLSERMGVARDDGRFIPLALSRQEIADLIGTTLETTIRLMSRWQKEDLVLTERDGFVIPQIEPATFQQVSIFRVCAVPKCVAERSVRCIGGTEILAMADTFISLERRRGGRDSRPVRSRNAAT